jgi:hypothetical protein
MRFWMKGKHKVANQLQHVTTPAPQQSTKGRTTNLIIGWLLELIVARFCFWFCFSPQLLPRHRLTLWLMSSYGFLS